jgi:serine/threonine protein kinase
MLQRIGRYEILERIAAGAQGTVYRARDTVLDRVVAVKVINQSVEDDPVYLEALRREARLAAGLDHPFIVTVHDFQVEDGIPYSLATQKFDSGKEFIGVRRRVKIWGLDEGNHGLPVRLSYNEPCNQARIRNPTAQHRGTSLKVGQVNALRCLDENRIGKA